MTTTPSPSSLVPVCSDCGKVAVDSEDCRHIENEGCCFACFGERYRKDVVRLSELPGQWLPSGWLPPDDLAEITFASWEWSLETAIGLNTATRWWLGDLIRFGKTRWGEKYAAALESTSLSYDTLAGYVWVCRSVDFCLRRQNLSWTHHILIAPLPPDQQVYWLDRAEEKGLTTRELEAELQAVKAALSVSRPRLSWLTDNSGPRWVVHCPDCGIDFDLVPEDNS